MTALEGAELELFARGLRDAAEASGGSDQALDAALADLGWHDAFDVDARVAVSVLFECQGWAHATSSALDHLLFTALGLHHGGPAAAVVLPPLGETSPPGRFVGDGTGCVVRGLATGFLDRCDTATVVAAAGTTGQVAAVTVEKSALRLRHVEGLDPELGLMEVTADPGVSGTTWDGPADWVSAVSLGHRALGHELVGASRAMLELARRHALERMQFGRPIASFQAVRHRLAESLVAVEAADALVAAAWDDPTPVNAAMAKAFAGRTARTVARHCQQVLAGIGFTSEHPFHRHFRRVLVLDQLLGGRSLTRTLGAEVMGTRRLPPVLPL
jgi:hypothetical protein